jgi:hypothetical protein
MPSSKNRRGPHSRKSEKRKRANTSAKTHDTPPLGQTNAPFEQDPKRRIGQHVGTGRAPMMKK